MNLEEILSSLQVDSVINIVSIRHLKTFLSVGFHGIDTSADDDRISQISTALVESYCAQTPDTPKQDFGENGRANAMAHECG